MTTATLYQVETADQINALKVTKVAKLTGDWEQYASLSTARANGRTYLLGFKVASDELDVYEFLVADPWVKLSPAKLNLKVKAAGKKDIVNSFLLGNRSYVAAYTAVNGITEFYEFEDDLSLSAVPFEYFRNHEPSITKNFTTVKFFTTIRQVTMLGYDMKTGYVAAYTVGMNATSLDVEPPLFVAPQWAHTWAPGWTRFAFFQFGGANFFLKTNITVGKENVNIDHLNDVLSAGTVEVGMHLEKKLPDKGKEFLSLDQVEPFVLGSGDPYFVTYEEDSGQVTLNRFNNDCLGWNTVVKVDSQTGAQLLRPISMPDGKVFLLVG